MKHHLNILAIEDSEEDAFLIKRLIEQGGFVVNFHLVQSATEMEEALRDERWDLILSDFNMPQFNGLEALEILKSSGVEIPFIIVSGAIGEDLAVECVKKGADDYIMKDNMKRLIPAIERELNESRIRKERKKAREEARDAQERLTFALQKSSIGGWDLDLEDHSALRTLEHDRIFGYESLLPEWTYEIFLGHVLPEDRPEVDRLFGEAIKSKTDWSFECRIKRNDGKIRWIKAIGGHKKEADGSLRRMAGIVQDITERRETETRLRESELRYKTLFEDSVVPVWEEDFSELKKYLEKLKKRGVKNLRSYFKENPGKLLWCASAIKITEVNQTSVDFFGVKSKVDLILSLPLFFTEESMQVFLEEIIALANGNTEFEGDIPIRFPSGTIKYIHILLHVLPGHYDTLEHVLVSWIDITDRRNYEIALMESERVMRELNRYIEEVRENERLKLSLNLHDDLGQKLTALKMELAWLAKNPDVKSDKLDKKLKSMSEIIDESINTVRKISADLRPGMLNDLGLVPTLQWNLNEFQKSSGIKCRLAVSGPECDLGPKISLVLYRIYQESMTNIARHSGAERVQVTIEFNNHDIFMKIRDNGKGINIESLYKRGSFGILGMKERASAIGGEMKIEGTPGRGTVVTVRIPIGESVE